MGTETFSVGISSSVSATSVPFLLVTSETDSSGSEFDGLIVIITQGFGFSTLSYNYPTFVDTLKTQNVINARIFSFYLSDDNWAANGYDISSVCLIGEVDLSYASGTVRYMPLYRQQGYWSVQMSAAKLGNTPITLSNDTAILDTGTSVILLPSSDAYSFFEALNRAGSCHVNILIICDCHRSHKIVDYPNLVIELNQGKSSYAMSPGGYFLDVRRIQDGKECYSLVEDAGNIPFWILGDVFLRNRYTIFDMDNLEVGIDTSAVNNPAPTSSPSGTSPSPGTPSGTSPTGGSSPETTPVNNPSTTSGNMLGLVAAVVLTAIFI